MTSRAVVSQRYQVVQPREILEFYRDLTEMSGFELETAGVLKGGRKFWALASDATPPTRGTWYAASAAPVQRAATSTPSGTTGRTPSAL